MSSYEKPQSPLYHKTEDTYFYPLTTVDQVIMEDGSRLNAKMLIVDTQNANEAEPNGINADTLGGYAASEYIRKDQVSVEVNYSVVGSLTAPENPTQNMIWLETNTPIGRVFFGNNKPNETFIEGDVWIATGTSSNVAFNALKIGNIYTNVVCPFNAQQVIDGVLVDVAAKSWQNGEWVEWLLYFYKDGSTYNEITGGWTHTKYESAYGREAYVSFQSNRIKVHTPADDSYITFVHTKSKIDVTDISQISVKLDTVQTFYQKVLIIDDGTTGNTPVASTMFYGDSAELDISGYTGSYYVGVVFKNTSAQMRVSEEYITEVEYS